ncbi:A24 family peptidase [Actinobacillus delphinicola]|uniref:A24 family peptidase n=1 Tax=Actinobacillus delphinicola TaxID=51161 RepID=UPI002441C475|nr:prepilin peptidase [Actinobacillus delphinicola]
MLPASYSISLGMVGIFFICSVAIVTTLIMISCSDVRHRLISNQLVFALGCAILPYSILLHGNIYFVPALVTLAIGFFLFLIHIIGAGDIKLLSILVLAIPPSQLMFFFFFVTVLGVILALGGLIFFRRNVKERGLPYGVAIAGGFLLQEVLFFPLVS